MDLSLVCPILLSSFLPSGEPCTKGGKLVSIKISGTVEMDSPVAIDREWYLFGHAIDGKMGKPHQPTKKPIHGSPFTVQPQLHLDPSKCVLLGPGLQHPIVGIPIELALTFQVENPYCGRRTRKAQKFILILNDVSALVLD